MTGVQTCALPISGQVSGQIVLNSDNTIQINGVNILTTGVTTQGIENAAGTLGTAPAGLNAVTAMGVVGQSYLFTPPQAVVFNLAGPVTYNWSGNNGFSSSSANAVDNPTATTVYTLTVSDGLCSSSTQVTSNVHTPPTAVAFNGGPYCDGQNASFYGLGTSSAAVVAN